MVSPKSAKKKATKKKATKKKVTRKKATKKKVTKKKATKKASVTKPVKKPDDLAAVFKRLRGFLHRYRKKLIVYEDSEKHYGVNAKTFNDKNKPWFFGGVGMRKGYVSFYLFPVYCKPKLLAKISPQLKKRMQGKSCFNFKTIDKEVFAELDALTEASYQQFVKDKIIL